jgi:hypothetical protein
MRMKLQDELLQHDLTLWTGGPDAYRRRVADECLLAFAPLAGVLDREKLVASIGDAPRWEDVRADPVGLLRAAPDVAILTYRATARRQGGDPYSALVSSAYVRRDNDWKLVFHQHTAQPDPS